MRNLEYKAGLALLFTLVIGHANPEELITFNAGQPARAAEVNANFKLLQDKLKELGSFENLSEEQVAAIKRSVGTASIKRATANCRTNPAALTEALSYGPNDLATIAVITLQGNCHAKYFNTAYDFTLILQGDTATGAGLIAATDGSWDLLGGFNGGLFLSDLTLTPPADRVGVLFSRASQGNLRNVVINGGRVGVSITANAQAFLSNVQITNTIQTAISVAGGGDLRFTGNSEQYQPLVKTSTGTGLYVEAGSALIADTTIEAPQALSIILNGTAFSFLQGTLKAVGDLYMRDSGVFSANNFEVTGNVNVEQSNFNAFNLKSKGKFRADNGSVIRVGQGTFEAINPGVEDYFQSTAIELGSNSTLRLGANFNNESSVLGRTEIRSSTLTAFGVSFEGTVRGETATLRLENSQFTNTQSTNQDALHLSVGGATHLINSTFNNTKVFVVDGAHLTCTTSQFNGTTLGFRHANFNSSECTGNQGLDFFASSSSFFGSNFENSVLIARGLSQVSFGNSQIGLLHLESGANADLYQSTVTGTGATPWGDDSIRVGFNSIVDLNESSLINPRTFVIDGGMLRLQNGSNINNANLSCSPRGYLQVWAADRNQLNIGSSNCAE